IGPGAAGLVGEGGLAAQAVVGVGLGGGLAVGGAGAVAARVVGVAVDGDRAGGHLAGRFGVDRADDERAGEGLGLQVLQRADQLAQAVVAVFRDVAGRVDGVAPALVLVVGVALDAVGAAGHRHQAVHGLDAGGGGDGSQHAGAERGGVAR